MIDRHVHYEHRLAWLYMTGSWPKHTIDHVNMIRDDNRWGNLREATSQENVWNRGVASNNKTGLKGVRRSRKRFMALIRVAGKDEYLGTYDSAGEAHAAYAKRAAEVHGEFFRSN